MTAMPVSQFTGLAASPGVAIGPAFVLRGTDRVEVEAAVGSPEDELARWRAARERVRATLTALAEQARTRVGPSEATIFEAQAEMAADPELESAVSTAITSGRSAAQATEEACKTFEAQLAALEDVYLRQRADDVREIERGIMRALAGREPFELTQPPRGAILCADELPAGVLVRIDRSALGGLALGTGGVTSHIAILARTLGVPAVVGLGVFLDQVGDADLVAIDGNTGQLYVNPSGAELDALRRSVQQFATERQELAAVAAEPAVTPDGVALELWANLGGLDDVAPALAAGASGVGLLRTEFLIADREALPSEDEQYATYRQIVEAMGGRPVIIRTFDIGGDKPVPALHLPPETNPFLGYRAIRIGLDHPDLLSTQMRAIVHAAEGGYPVRIMLPMVATVEEVRRARDVLNGLLQDDPVPMGIMVEIPSAALNASAFAGEVDFFSIGSNDLTQYTLAADRTDERLSALYQPLHPAVLRLIQMTASAAKGANIACGVCGEMGGDPRATAVLMGLGVTELSMSAGSLGYVKREVRRTPSGAARRLAAEVLRVSTTQEVLECIETFRASRYFAQ
jgi:phosphoenolpyruvate-protein phosphotransferase (PTS system enzyme I)